MGPGGLTRWLAVTGLLLVAGCSGGGSERAAERHSPSASRSGSASPAAPTSAPAASFPATPVDPVSLQALMAKEYDGRALHTRGVLLRTAAYTRYAVTYRSGRLRISGVMNVPRGKGSFPVLVLLRGYIEPGVYHTGQGLMREQDYLAREGYVALHVDYRGHAGSDPAPRVEEELRLGYTDDAIKDTVDNFNRWTRPERSDVARRIIREHGSPETNPAFWRAVSPRTFFDRITEPLLIHHGTADESCPYRWSRATLGALRRAGKDARLLTYEGEAHAFGPQWARSMRRTVAFFDRQLPA